MADKCMVNERYLVEKLREKIDPKYQRTFPHINLATSANFREKLYETFGCVPVLNEIDLILLENDGKLKAVEVKLCKVKNGRLTKPFYDGIGQALSLLRYGFDNVALWHLFLGEIDQQKLNRYGAYAWSFIRDEQLRLPLDFSYFEVTSYPDNPEFIVMQKTSPLDGKELLRIDDPDFRITWKYPNPLCCTPQSQIFRQAIEQRLKISCNGPMNYPAASYEVS